MVLVDKQIKAAIKLHKALTNADHELLNSKTIEFNAPDYSEELLDDLVSVNSIDLRLSNKLLRYKNKVVDAKKKNDNEVEEVIIPEEGLTILPNQFFLGSTVETLGSNFYYIMLKGKSSIKRLGLSVCDDAGSGDLGFIGNWTLELTPTIPITIYPNMKIVQALFLTAEVPEGLYDGKYTGESAKGTVASKYHENFKK